MTTINVRYWLVLIARQRHQYRGASSAEREKLRVIWEGQRIANLESVERMTCEAWTPEEIDATQRKADHWAVLLQWADDIDSQSEQLSLALETLA